MKTIRKIFVDDIVNLAKNFFALVIVVGICFLPALYAWFNIYSNWDPYGNTGSLKFAVISLDEGYTDEDGVYHNQGDTIIDNLHDNTSVNWQFVETEEDAVNGVYSGEYYAAVVISADFSYNMYNFLTEDVESPTLIFYENQKKNPVATKISDTVVSTLQNNINVAFKEVVISEIFSSASEISDELQNDDDVETAIENLRELSADLTSYSETLTNIIDNDQEIKDTIESAKTDANNLKNQAQKAADAVEESEKANATTDVTFSQYSADLESVLDLINNSLTEIDTDIASGQISGDLKDKELKLQASARAAGDLVDYLTIIASSRVSNTNVQVMLETATELYSTLSEYDVDTSIAGDALQHTESEIDDTLSKANAQITKLKSEYTDEVEPKVKEAISDLGTTLTESTKLLNSVGETFGNLLTMFTAIENTVDSANTSLVETNKALIYVNGRLQEVIEKVDSANEGEKLEVLIEALSGDPELYGKFFSTPVTVETEAVYPIENYGSAVAPFYSTLAFWVGALILTAIIKVKPDKDKYPDASPRQLYFGRYVLYWVLGQIQAVVIVLGDIYLLHIQCIHPLFFMLAASVTATTFTILIYSLVVTWGDVGKALSVVLVVIQIAGSSGTYPIELLPEFFKKVYIFFPFPYAINAIRECLCGMYKYDYIKYLLCLGIFIGVSLVIGLFVRIPFESINHYVEERMEDTEMM